jgi:hypothetical protein
MNNNMNNNRYLQRNHFAWVPTGQAGLRPLKYV